MWISIQILKPTDFDFIVLAYLFQKSDKKDFMIKIQFSYIHGEFSHGQNFYRVLMALKWQQRNCKLEN